MARVLFLSNGATALKAMQCVPELCALEDGSLRLRKCPCEQYAAAAGQQVLATVELVRDRRTHDARARARVPKRFAVARVQRQEIAHRIAGEGKP